LFFAIKILLFKRPQTLKIFHRHAFFSFDSGYPFAFRFYCLHTRKPTHYFIISNTNWLGT
ncbi:unnamed protein product, partial [Arabidopsis halleri]